MRIVKLSDLSENERKKVLEEQQARLSENQRASQQLQRQANERFNDVIRREGEYDTSGSTFSMKDFLKVKKESSSKESYKQFKKANGLTLWDAVKETASDLGKIGQNTVLGIGLGINNFQQTLERRAYERDQNRFALGEEFQRKNIEKRREKQEITDEEAKYWQEKLDDNPLSTKKMKERNEEAIQKIQNKKESKLEKVNKNVESISNPISKKLAELTPSVGQMVPSFIPGVGIVYATGSASGQYYDDAKQRGMKDEEADTYSGMMGLIEGATEMIGVKNLSKAGKGVKELITGSGKTFVKEGSKQATEHSLKTILKDYGIGIADNVMQEALIDPIQELTAQTVAGKDKANWNNIGQKMLEDGINGGLVSAILGGANMGIQSCTGVVQNMKNDRKITRQEFQTAVKDASQKLDTSKMIISSMKQQVNKYKDYYSNKNVDNNTLNWLNKAENIIEQNNNQNISDRINFHSSERKLTYEESARKYNLDTKNATINGIYEVANKRGISTFYDDTVFSNSNQNAKWVVDSDGNRSVILNPNANTETSLQSVMIHELTHDIEGSDSYHRIHEMVMSKLKQQDNYNDMMLDIANAYRNEYTNMDKNEFSTMIEKEAVADYLGENLGNQEFINELVRSQDRSTIQKIIDWVSDKITSLKNTVTGNQEANYWNQIKKNFERAYQSKYQGRTMSERYSIQTDSNGKQYVKVDTDQDIFEGIDKKDYNKVAKMYMQDYLKGDVILGNKDTTNIGRRGINKYTNPRQDTRFFEEKMKLTPELQNVLEISKKVSIGTPTKETTKFPNWEYYKFKFELGGKNFEGLINIGIDKEGNKHFYEINKIHNTRNIECFIETKKYYGYF